MTPRLSKQQLVVLIEYRARAMRREVFRRWVAALWAALTGSRTRATGTARVRQ